MCRSFASTEAKVKYLQKTLGRNLEKEKAFPLLLHYNYHGVIKARCELLKDRVKHFELEEVLPLSDEQFCIAYNISMEELESKKTDRAQKQEKDILWAYVPAV